MSDVANAPIDLANNSELIADLARFSEGVLTEQQIRRKWRHLDKAPDILGTIMTNDGNSPRHRIEAAKELRVVADNGPEVTRRQPQQSAFNSL